MRPHTSKLCNLCKSKLWNRYKQSSETSTSGGFRAGLPRCEGTVKAVCAKDTAVAG